MDAELAGWQFWIDRGGTFTDIVARTPAGSVLTHKLLSDNPSHYDDPAIEGIRRLISTDPDAGPVEAVRMATTVATNAMLERAGERTLFVTSRGFKDALRIGYQNRPYLFTLDIELPEMLYESVIEVDERVGPRGEVIVPLDEAAVAADLAEARASGVETVAIVLMHGYRHSAHEERVGELARSAGFSQIRLATR